MIRLIRVRNFKSLNDVSLQLGVRNVLVGPNMSGKSNFLSVFKFLTGMVLPAPGVYGLQNAVNMAGGFAELAWRGAQSNLVSITLEGDLPIDARKSPNETWAYRLDFVSDGRGHVTVQTERLTLRSSHGECELITKDKDGRRILVDREQGRISTIQDADRSALEFEIPDWEGNLLRTLFASFRYYALIPPLMKQVNPTATARVLEESGNNFSSWLLMLQTRYQDYFQKLNRAAQGALPDLANVFTYPTPQTTVFIASTEKHLKSAVPVWQMSDGELCFLAWLSLILCPPDLAGPAYFIEELENHLHPRLIKALMEVLGQVQSASAITPSQVFITTHSLELVDSSSLEDLIVFEKREGATVCKRPSEKAHLHEMISEHRLGLADLYYSGALGHD